MTMASLGRNRINLFRVFHRITCFFVPHSRWMIFFCIHNPTNHKAILSCHSSFVSIFKCQTLLAWILQEEEEEDINEEEEEEEEHKRRGSEKLIRYFQSCELCYKPSCRVLHGMSHVDRGLYPVNVLIPWDDLLVLPVSALDQEPKCCDICRRCIRHCAFLRVSTSDGSRGDRR